MNRLLFAAMMFAVLGHTAGANVAQKNHAKSYECFTDDDYGRKLPCSYSYQPAERMVRAKNYECFTDEGYGRRRMPCS